MLRRKYADAASLNAWTRGDMDMQEKEEWEPAMDGESHAGVPANQFTSAACIWMSFQNGRSLNLDRKPEK
jgi:hypothetical protein